jgi:hypothetical protein
VPAFGLIGIHMAIIATRLQMCIRVIVDVDVGVRLLQEIYASWRDNYIEWLLPSPGHVPP